MEGSNKRKSLVESLWMKCFNFKNKTLFLSFAAIITTRDGWDGINFYIGNRMVDSIKMSRDRFVNIMEGVRCTTFKLLYAEIYILKESVRPVIRRSWLPFPSWAMKFFRVKIEIDDLSLTHVKLSSYSSILSWIFIITRISRHYYIIKKYNSAHSTPFALH